MGLSGSGKSTLVRCISRLIEPTSGTVKMDDIDVTKMSGGELLDLRRSSGEAMPSIRDSTILWIGFMLTTTWGVDWA